MNKDALSLEAKKAVDLARDEAMRTNYPYVSTSHLLVGLCKLGQHAAVDLESQGITLQKLRETVEEENEPARVYVEIKKWPLTDNCEKVMAIAIFKASEDRKEVSTTHLLEAILKVENCSGSIALNKLGYQQLYAQS
jgi:ATP-dependent Clp protease ATP-binding subunit ClpA